MLIEGCRSQAPDVRGAFLDGDQGEVIEPRVAPVPGIRAGAGELRFVLTILHLAVTVVIVPEGAFQVLAATLRDNRRRSQPAVARLAIDEIAPRPRKVTRIAPIEDAREAKMVIRKTPRADIGPHGLCSPFAGLVIHAEAKEPAAVSLKVKLIGVLRVDGIPGIGEGLGAEPFAAQFTIASVPLADAVEAVAFDHDEVILTLRIPPAGELFR